MGELLKVNVDSGFGGFNHKLNLLNNGIKIEFIPPLDIRVAFHKVTNDDVLPSKDPWKLELFGKMEDKGKFKPCLSILKQLLNKLIDSIS